MLATNTRRRCPGRALATTVLTVGLLSAALSVHGDILYKWIQLVPKGDVEAQAVVRTIVRAADDCPSIVIDDQTVALKKTKRKKPGSGFEGIKLCESFLDSDHTGRFSRARFSDNQNTLTIPDLSKGVPLTEMIGFGCSGCRGDGPQDQCTHDDWPFWQVNTHGAENTSAELPPLVIHLGDIRYADQKTRRDYWSKEDVDGGLAGWKEEYFDAVKPLLDKGLWINTRGNHEACLLEGKEKKGWMVKKKAKKLRDRGSAWFYFFGYDKKVSCKSVFKAGDMVEPFVFDARTYEGTLDEAKWGDQKVRMVVLDTVRTGDARDGHAEETKQMYRDAFDEVTKKPKHKARPLWILSHIPIYSLNGKTFKATVVLDALNQSKLNEDLSDVAMAIAAHRHEALLVNPGVGNPATEGPIQYAAGHAGVTLSGKSETQLACDLADVRWTPIGEIGDDVDEVESETTWAVLRRPNWGYLRGDFRNGHTRFAMNFYSLKQDQWYSDATLNCESDSEHKGRFMCPYLPRHSRVKCP